MSHEQRPEPLSIWFFVGLILCAYGGIVAISGAMPTARPTVLAELRPALWWGAITAAFGIVLLVIGLRSRAAARSARTAGDERDA